MDQNIVHKKNKFKSRYIPGLLIIIAFAIMMSLFHIGTTAVYGVSNEWNGSAATSFAGGTGTESDPYLISTGEQLAYLSQQVNKASGNVTYEGKYIRLTQDILLNSMNADGTFVSQPYNRKKFTSIGSAGKPFKGIFDGNGFEIIGLYIDISYVEYQGLFGYADTGSEIKNLKISGSIAGGNKSGAVAGYTNGLISGCEVNCPVTIAWTHYHGGIAGYAGVNSIISNCNASGTIEGSECVGGIAGYTEGKITECNSDKTITGVKKVGGIAGYAAGTGAEISNCSFSGTVLDVNNFYTGGIAGQTDGLITGCAVNAVITSKNSYVGGVAGYAAGAGSKIINCTVTATVSATGGAAYAGGVAGRTDGEIKGCVVNVAVSAPNSYIGGVAGYSHGSGSVISDCSISGTVTANAGQGYVGGVAGISDGMVTRCSAECSVTGNGQHHVGGVVGRANTGSEISNSSSSGNITGIGQVGGIAGSTDGVIKICINTGNVNGSDGHIGGVAGETGNNSTVSNSFNSGAVAGGGQGGIGGIVGYVSPGTIVHHNLNKGTVDGPQYVGCVIGNVIDEDNAWNNYYYDYTGAPGGTTTGDILDDDGAVPVGDMTWEEVQDLLNENNDAGDHIWNQDLDDDGVPKPSEGTESSAVFKIVNAVIKEGKYYTAAQLETGAAATVTAESVFTVAFGLQYKVNCAPEEQTLKLKNDNAATQLPAGTSVIMLAGDAYYYINLTQPVPAITLGEFIKMGSADQRYSPAAATKDDTAEYLFIFDFSKTAIESQFPADPYIIELSHPDGGHTGALPAVTVAGKNEYNLFVDSTANNMFEVSVSKTPVTGYDYKTDGKAFACEFYLEKEGAGGTEIAPLPAGAKINGTVVSAVLPYAFLPLDFDHTATVSLDMSECAAPLAAGKYTLQARAYSCTDILNPRSGYLLAGGSTDINLTAPVAYAIKANAENRVFDQSSSSSIPVVFSIQTLGPGSVKATLQQKYAMSYLDMEGQIDQPVTITGGQATLRLPAGAPKGTYRFVLSLYDGSGEARARSVENIIIK